ncbi:MAG TPA: PQQ-binding-like beta-propeller repeat protein [Ktedonobacteraceae bacterium]|nr:PQQ-binding-like beta-propeller repeat protein [Ktedonobacteraceae bacterium]
MTNQLAQRLLGKWKGYTFAALILTFVAAGVLIGLPRNFAAHAAGATLTISPTGRSYNPPDSLIGVTGSGYSANETVNVYWNYTGPGTGTLEGSPKASASGSFLFYFTTPLDPTGTYTIAGVGQTSGSVATGTFKLLPGLFGNPPGAGTGTPIQLTGNDFGAGEVVNVYWNYNGPGTGTLLGTPTADSTGSFTLNASIPSSPSLSTGGLNIVGVGQTSMTTGFYKFTFYAPTVALAPLSGSANIPLTVSAYGYKGGEKVSIFWNNATIAAAVGTTDLYGYLAPKSIRVPKGTAPGTYTVKVVGKSTHLSATNSYTIVAPGSNLSLSSGPVGVTVNVNGQGYAPGETVNILWNYTGPSTGKKVATVKAAFSGTVSTSFSVPAAANGVHTIAVVGVSSTSVTQNAFTLGNGLASIPAIASPGTNVTATGTGFQAGETVNLYLDSTSGSALGTTIADVKGNINKSLALPSSTAPGAHSLIGVGQTSHASFTTGLSVDTSWANFGWNAQNIRANSYENTLGSSNVSNLKLKWSASVGTNNLGSPSPVYANGVIYMAGPTGTLVAYDAITGTVKWQYDPKTGFPNITTPLVDPSAGLVFFGTLGHQNPGSPSPFYAVDMQTGILKWSVILPCNEFGEPSLAFSTIYIGTSLNNGTSGTVYALDEVSGKVDWKITTGGGVWRSIAVDTSTQTVFATVGDPSFQALALNALTGATKWQITVPNSSQDLDPGSATVVANGLVYFSDKNGYVYALHESDGSVAWATQIAKLSVDDVSTPAIAPNGDLYVGSLDNFLYDLNATTGAVNWKASNVGGLDSSPALANGVVYFASFNSNIYALDATTHAVLWTFTTGGKSFSSPIVVNGWLYCGSDDGKLYAFSL